MTKINLLKLAKEVNELYEDVPCSFGTIRVYHVPDAVPLSAVLGKPEPEQPMVRMKLATGGTQTRLSKPGDKGHDEWVKAKAEYDTERIRLHTATHIVAALRDIEYPDVSSPPTDMAKSVMNGHWPDNEMVRKKLWLDYTVFARRADSEAIYAAIARMNGEEEPTPDQVDEVKKNSV